MMWEAVNQLNFMRKYCAQRDLRAHREEYGAKRVGQLARFT